MVWRIVSRLAELASYPLALPSPALYALFDGLFQQCLLKHLSGDTTAIAAMQADARLALTALVGGTLQKA